MSQTLFIFGNHPTISRAEVLTVFPQFEITASGPDFIAGEGVDAAAVDLRRLGGVIKVAEVFASCDRLDYAEIATFLQENMGDGKLAWGASMHGISLRELKTLLIGVKKELQKAGRSARFVNKDFANLSSAQVELQGLLGKGIEIIAARSGRGYVLARTVAVQPFNDFKKRDYEKAARDARVGMLPPKLALMMVNLGCGDVQSPDTAVYDPFCGTGTVLVEAGLLGHGALGSDLDPRMVAAAETNLHQLQLKGTVWQQDAARSLAGKSWHVETTAIVTEGYLGPVFSKLPDAKTRDHIFRELAQLYKNFFGWARARRVVLTLPAYLESGQPRYFSSKVIQPVIEERGWERIDDGKLIYSRTNQVVGREVTVWERK